MKTGTRSLRVLEAIQVAVGVLFAFIFSATIFFVIPMLVEPDPPQDPDFMLECVYGWGQTPDNCRAILEGDDPPPLPDPEYNQGC
jgi:hypothetical protein